MRAAPPSLRSLRSTSRRLAPRGAARRWAWLLTSVGLLSAAPAAAEPESARAEARRLGQDASEALAAKDYPRAAELFRKADGLYHAPTLALGVARALAGLGQLVSARFAYEGVLREPLPKRPPEAFVRARADARAELALLAPRFATVVIHVTGGAGAASPVVTLDEQPLGAEGLDTPVPVDPGDHDVRASADGYAPARAHVTLAEGATQEVALALVSLATATPVPARDATATAGDGSARRRVGLGALAVGGAGVIVGAVAGGMFLARRSELLQGCPGGLCPPAEQGARDGYRALGAASTTGFVMGLAALGAGTALVLTAPKAGGAASARRAELWIAGTSLGARASF